MFYNILLQFTRIVEVKYKLLIKSIIKILQNKKLDIINNNNDDVIFINIINHINKYIYNS